MSGEAGCLGISGKVWEIRRKIKATNIHEEVYRTIGVGN